MMGEVEEFLKYCEEVEKLPIPERVKERIRFKSSMIAGNREKEMKIDIQETIKGVLEFLRERKKRLHEQLLKSDNELEKSMLMEHINEISNIEEEIERLWKSDLSSVMEEGSEENA